MFCRSRGRPSDFQMFLGACEGKRYFSVPVSAECLALKRMFSIEADPDNCLSSGLPCSCLCIPLALREIVIFAVY